MAKKVAWRTRDFATCATLSLSAPLQFDSTHTLDLQNSGHLIVAFSRGAFPVALLLTSILFTSPTLRYRLTDYTKLLFGAPSLLSSHFILVYLFSPLDLPSIRYSLCLLACLLIPRPLSAFCSALSAFTTTAP